MIWAIIIVLILAIVLMAIVGKDKEEVNETQVNEPQKPAVFVDKNGRLHDSKGRFVKSE